MQKVFERYRYSTILLTQLVKTDFKIRYQGSVLGYMWSLLRPLFLFVILYFVFARFLRIGDSIPHYPVYLLLGIVLWNYFVEVTTGGVAAIVGKGDLLRKLNFPKYVIIFAGSFSALINLALNLIVVAAFMVVTGVPISWRVLLIIPVIVQLFVFALGLAFFLSTLFVRFRDISYIWDVIVQAAFYATPILYPVALLPDHIAKLLLLNPMAQMIQDARYALITTETVRLGAVYGGRTWMWAIPILLTAIVALVAALYFRARSKYFAEEV